MKNVWKTVKDTVMPLFPAALAALIGYAIARTKLRTAQLQDIKKEAPHVPVVTDTRRARRRRRR